MIDEKFITDLKGKQFVLFEGLLNEFHKNGGQEIRTEIINTDPLIIQATVKGEKGTYQGIGDANEENTNRLIAKHCIRMAETRAIARALRWYNNIGMCSADELGGEEVRPTPKEPVGVHGKCRSCGADRIVNPKTGKVFCQAKCFAK